MQLDAWTTSANATDKARRKRLTIGYAVGAITVTATLSLITLTAHGQVFEAEETLDVSLVEPPPSVGEPEPEVQPEPPPPVEKKKHHRKHKMSMAAPTDVPGGTPDEADPNGNNPYDGDLDDVFDGEGGGGAPEKVKPVVVKRKPPPEPPAFVFVSEREHSTPAVAVSQPRPPYPADARAEGVEGTVVVQFLVQKDGSIGDVRVVRGDSRLAAAVVAAVKRWKFEAATFEGRPVATWRTASFPFRLKT
jgi:periplasmic protein TonB